MTGSIHIGTSGWSYRDWAKDFYPKGIKSAGYLAYYATQFKVTELNSSYYHLPRRDTVLKWRDTVGEDFKICPKISKEVTHIKRLSEPEQTLPKFFEVFNLIKEKLGPVLIQLPPSLSFDEEKVAAFYSVLNQYKGYHFALEPRHDSWSCEKSIGMMKKNGIAYVMANWDETKPYTELITAPFVYVRFHGSPRYKASYSDSFLEAFAQKIDHWKKKGLSSWIFFNNTVTTAAVDNAKKLMALTG